MVVCLCTFFNSISLLEARPKLKNFIIFFSNLILCIALEDKTLAIKHQICVVSRGKNASIIISLRWVGQKVKFKSVIKLYAQVFSFTSLNSNLERMNMLAHRLITESKRKMLSSVYNTYICTYSALSIFLIEINLHVFLFPRQLSSIYLSKTVKWFVYCRNSIHFNLQFLIERSSGPEIWGFFLHL